MFLTAEHLIAAVVALVEAVMKLPEWDAFLAVVDALLGQGQAGTATGVGVVGSTPPVRVSPAEAGPSEPVARPAAIS